MDSVPDNVASSRQREDMEAASDVSPYLHPTAVTFSPGIIYSIARMFSENHGQQSVVDGYRGLQVVDNDAGIRHVLSGLGNLFHALSASPALGPTRSDLEMQERPSLALPNPDESENSLLHANEKDPRFSSRQPRLADAVDCGRPVTKESEFKLEATSVMKQALEGQGEEHVNSPQTDPKLGAGGGNDCVYHRFLPSSKEYQLLKELGMGPLTTDTDISKLVCHGTDVSPDDMQRATGSHSRGEWVLTWQLRSALCRKMLSPRNPSTLWANWNMTVIESMTGHLHELEAFILDAATSTLATVDFGDEPLSRATPFRCPNLEYFVSDAVELLGIFPRLQASSRYEETHPFNQLSHVRLDSWFQRWQICTGLSLDTVKRRTYPAWTEYNCGLCDALFGLWPAPGRFLYHTGGCAPVSALSPWFANCLRSLTTFAKPTSASLIESIDYQILDSAFIESRGPFRFKRTDTLSRHLSITAQDEILFYPHWRKWAFLAWNTPLQEATAHNNRGRHVTFDTLTNARRLRTEDVGYSCGITRISKDLLIMGIFCFYQGTLTASQKRSQQCNFLRRAVRFYPQVWPRRKSSLKIGKRIGMDLVESEVRGYVAGFIGLQSEDWKDLFESCLPFLDREIELHKTLIEWKPKTVLQMRYAGYGGVDPVGLYAFYFAILLGIVTFVGLGITAAQTYAGFKALGQ